MARGKIYTNRKRTIAVGEEKTKKGKYFKVKIEIKLMIYLSE